MTFGFASPVQWSLCASLRRHHRSAMRSLIALLVIGLVGCAALPTDWALRQQSGGIDYYTRQGPHASLPEFKAVVVVQAPLPRVMALVTDFSRHPEWVYGCQQTSVIALKGFTQAYLYQVVALPIISDRDMILHGQTFSDETGDEIRIQLNAAPDYCQENTDSDCDAIRQSTYVRVKETQGEFVLTRLGDNRTRIQWTQFLDPAGALPHWLYRANLSQVPIRSLRQLKSLLETGA